MWGFLKRLFRRVWGLFRRVVRYTKLALKIGRVILAWIDSSPISIPTWVIMIVDRLDVALRYATEYPQAAVSFLGEFLEHLDELIRTVPTETPGYQKILKLYKKAEEYLKIAEEEVAKLNA